MYSLTFCVRVMSPERHNWKPAVQVAAVMLRTPPSPAMVTNHQRARTPRNLQLALCCHGNATDAPIANPPNSAQLGSSLYHAAKLHLGPCSSVGVRPRTDRQTDTQTRVTTIHFASSTTHAKCNNILVHPKLISISIRLCATYLNQQTNSRPIHINNVRTELAAVSHSNYTRAEKKYFRVS